MTLKTTLNQWLTLLEIDKAGSIQAAALTLNKSHTTLIYAIDKLEHQLGIKLVTIEKRKAVLTNDGKSLLRKAQSMIEQAKALEDISSQIAQSVESEIIIAIDHLCERNWLYKTLEQFFYKNNATSVKIIETSLSKTTAVVEDKKSDISIINIPITNQPSEFFGMVKMVVVVAQQHPLANKSQLCLADLETYRQVVIRDLGESSSENAGWLKSSLRITVDNFDHAWQAVKQGLGYCRMPQHIINSHHDDNIIILNVEHANCFQVPLHLTLPKGAQTGPAASMLYKLLLASTENR